MWWKRKQQDFNAEIEAHLQLEADRFQADGLTPTEARAAALRSFGNRTLAEEQFYESGRWMLWDHFRRDIRFALRVFLKDARFSVLAILGLALGIGLSTAIFTFINEAVRVRAAAGETDPSYVDLSRFEKGSQRPDPAVSYPAYRYYQGHATSFRAVKAESFRFPFILGAGQAAGKRTEAQDAQGRFESSNFLSATGLHPAIGRSFSAAEEQSGGPQVALLSFGFWETHFAADPGVLGKTVILNARSLTIIGVADPQYGVGDPSDFYLPLGLQPVLFDSGGWQIEPNEHWLMLDAWLRPGVTARRAQAEMDVLSSALRPTKPANPGSSDPADEGVIVSPNGPNPAKAKEVALLAMATILAVSMILLIACSNLANLLLARAVVRRREIGVRLSLGASRARLICQLMTESLLLSAAGGAFGLLFSYWLAKSLLVLVNAGPGLSLHFDVRVILYVVFLVLATGISFGLAPALVATRTNLSQALHSDGLSGGARSQSQRIWSARNGLVIVPLAVSLMLLLGAGMTVRLVREIYLNGPAFDASHLVVISLPLNLQGYDEARTRQFQEALHERIRVLPEVTSVALAGALPLSNSIAWMPLVTEGSAVSSGDSSPRADFNIVSAEFFDTIGAPVIRGRAFTAFDREGEPPVAMVNQELVRRYWPGADPIGKRVRLATADGTFFEVVGIAPDWEVGRGALRSVRPTVYIPYGQGKLFFHGVKLDAPAGQMQFIVRTARNPADVKAVLRQEVLAADPSLRVTIQTIDEMIESQFGPVKTISLLLSALGALALLMASVGIYAVLAYAISQRTREIGIRMALGAQRREILALVMQRTLTLIVWSIGLGLLGALALNRVFSSNLGKLGKLDAATCASVSLLLGAVAVVASYLPARKALSVDAAQALRSE